MIILLSPSKTLDFKSEMPKHKAEKPLFLNKANEAVSFLQQLNIAEIKELMSISQQLAILNKERFMEWKTVHNEQNARAALFAYKGDVYDGLKALNFKTEDIDFAQNHLRIISGLYGILRPLDLIMPYRLEMGLKFQTQSFKNLYEFWNNEINEFMIKDFAKQKDKYLINLASQEYFKTIDNKKLKAKIITPVFKEIKDGKPKMIAIFAKKARGLMANFIIKNKITDIQDIKAFNYDSYLYSEEGSDENNLLFLR